MLDIRWKPNKASSKILHEQIEYYIKIQISKGNWVIGTKLPSQRSLAETFEVNRSTVVEALENLKSEGIIEGRGKAGTFIVNNTWSLYLSSKNTNWKRYLDEGIHKPNLPIIQAINRLEFDDDMIRIGTGELSPSLFPYEKMKDVFYKMSENIVELGYLEAKGLLRLREVICKYVKKYGIETEPSSVMIVSGALQGLQLISLGIAPVGSNILIEKPSYLSSLHVFQSSGMKLTGIEMNEGGLQFERILKNISKRNMNFLYTIPTFHNPTGITMPYERREKILDLCKNERIPIIEDDVYRELWIDEKPPVPIKAIDRNGNVLYLGSTSKSLAPGFRIGWIIGPEPIIDRLSDIKMQTDYGSSSLSQWAIAEWIASGYYEEYLEFIREELRKRRDLALNVLEDKFKSLANWNIPKGGFYIWLTLKEEINLKYLFSEAEKNKILINPGNVYDNTNSRNLRISYSYASYGDIEFALAKLADIISKIFMVG